MPEQQYDERGRPVNPATKQMNKDIIRAHNEVMAVIGVAEADHPTHDQEHELRIQHELSEEQTAKNIAFAAKWSLDAIGIFGAHGLRQRTLVRAKSRLEFGSVSDRSRSTLASPKCPFGSFIRTRGNSIPGPSCSFPVHPERSAYVPWIDSYSQIGLGASV